MKLLKNILATIILGMILCSCYSEDNWLEDNWEKTGNHYPNIADIMIIDAQNAYSEGDAVQFDVRFWSEDPVERIVLYHQYGENDQEVATMYSYSEAGYSEATQTDSLLIEYEVPPGSSGTAINFEIVVENENDLTASNTDATNTAIHNLSIDVE